MVGSGVGSGVGILGVGSLVGSGLLHSSPLLSTASSPDMLQSSPSLSTFAGSLPQSSPSLLISNLADSLDDSLPQSSPSFSTLLELLIGDVALAIGGCELIEG